MVSKAGMFGKLNEENGRTLAFNPSLQIASQSAFDCSEAAGLVNSICQLAGISIWFPGSKIELADTSHT